MAASFAPATRVVGSALIGQNFASDRYFWPRPSATGDAPYNAGASSGSNLGPTSAEARRTASRPMSRACGRRACEAAIPADAATASGSGLDPHISPDYARSAGRRASPRRAACRGGGREPWSKRTIEGRLLGLIGEPRVNVLAAQPARWMT